MLARIPGIPNAVCKIPVTNPATIPARNAKTSASAGFMPPRINITATAPPVASEPSTVKSAKSKIRNVIYTPSAIIPQIIPCATFPGSARTSVIGSKAAK